MADKRELLSREQMEEMMADYALNGLASAEAERFEEALPLYPDIRSDVEKVRAAFAQFAKEDYIESNTRRARTLSVHVQERLATRRPAGNLRRLWPALVIGMLLLFMFVPGGFFFKSEPAYVAVSSGTAAQNTQEELNIVTRDEVLQVLDAVDASATEVANALPDRMPMHSDGRDVVIDMPTEGSFLSDDLIEEMAEEALYPMSDDALSGAWYSDLRESDIQQLFEELEDYDIM